MVEAKRSTKFRHQQRKKVEPEIKNARPDFLFNPSVAMNKRDADSGECFF
jgi:hypothetical protein